MNIGHIHITGQIGSSYDSNGNIETKGVELVDVIEQAQSLGDVEEVHVHINSQGGFVSVGNSIHDFIKTLPNMKTFAENLCASIATKIHLAAPLQNRFVEEGCNYMIHNPFLSNVTGDAEKLASLAESIKETEKQLEQTYAKATGLSKEALSGLMAVETELTPEKCVKFKFASEIIKKEQARAVALFYNKKENEMKKSFVQRAALALAVMNGKATATIDREEKALLIDTDNGTIETPYGDLSVGDPATIDGEPAADGTYQVTGEGELTLVDGSTITTGATIEILEGLVVTITPQEVEGENKDEEEAKAQEEAKAKAIEEAKAKQEAGEELTDEEKALLEEDEDPQAKEIEELKAKLEASELKNGKLEGELTESKAEAEEVVQQLEKAAKLGSSFTPPRAEASFRRNEGGEEKSTKEKMQEKKESYN